MFTTVVPRLNVIVVQWLGNNPLLFSFYFLKLLTIFERQLLCCHEEEKVCCKTTHLTSPFCRSCLQVGCQEIEGFEGDWKISFSSWFGERPFLPHQVTPLSSVLGQSHFIKLDRYILLLVLSMSCEQHSGLVGGL